MSTALMRTETELNSIAKLRIERELRRQEVRRKCTDSK